MFISLIFICFVFSQVFLCLLKFIMGSRSLNAHLIYLTKAIQTEYKTDL